jgi:hypothetical protein
LCWKNSQSDMVKLHKQQHDCLTSWSVPVSIQLNYVPMGWISLHHSHLWESLQFKFCKHATSCLHLSLKLMHTFDPSLHYNNIQVLLHVESV